MRTNPGFDTDVVRPIFFAEFLFDTGPLRLNSSDHDITWGGYLWTGVGQLGSISEYTSTQGTQATSLRLTLQGLPASMVRDLANVNERRKPVKMFLVLLGDDYKLLTAPFIWYIGTVDSLAVSVSQTASASVSASSRLINWARAANTRYTDEEQQSKHPGDRGLSFLTDLPQRKIAWGS